MSSERAHPTEPTLNDHAEEALDPERRAEVERHLAACPSCRREVEEIRALLERARELPAGIGPRRDLWPGVESRIRSSEGAGTAGRGGRPESARGRSTRLEIPARGRWTRWPSLAAAAAVLMAVGVGGYLWWSGGPGAADTARSGPPEASTPVLRSGAPEGRLASAALDPAERSYLRTTAELLEILDRNRDQLAPETRAALDRTLSTIDTAIRNLREALERDPNSRRLAHLLEATYRQKIDVLRSVARAVQM